jgi:hypothetical protein
MKAVEGRELLGGLIVGLKGGHFISELLATVELPDFGQVNFGKPAFYFGVLLIGDHAVSQLAFGGDMVSTFQRACELREVPPRDHPVPFGTLYVFLGFFTAPPDGGC